MKDLSIKEFIDDLCSKNPTPGGGAACALVGAVAVALAGMVAEISHGKKGYESFEGDVKKIIDRVSLAKDRLLCLMEEDARAYSEVSNIYKTKAVTEEERKIKREKLESSLLGAAKPPLYLLELLVEIGEIFDELKTKGGSLLVSDVKIGAIFLDAAIKGAAINVFVNTKLMNQKEEAHKIDTRVNELLLKNQNRAKKFADGMEELF